MDLTAKVDLGLRAPGPVIAYLLYWIEDGTDEAASKTNGRSGNRRIRAESPSEFDLP
jgi:hypothetical protein